MRWSPELRRLGWLVERPIAHRGLHDAAQGVIENTASAFARAVAQNYAIECDVQLTGDGEAVVFHDETLDRLTEETGPLLARSADNLRCVKFQRGGDRIPALAEMLEQVSGRVPLVIELKTHWTGEASLVERVLRVLKDYCGPYALMSFDPDVVEAIRVRSPATVRGIVADRTIDPYYSLLPFERRLELRHFGHVGRTMPDFVSFQWTELPYPPVSAFRDSGRPVITWTIRSPQAAGLARRFSDQITFEGFLA